MDEIFKNNLELITEQLKISNQFYLDQLKTKDDEIKRLKYQVEAIDKQATQYCLENKELKERLDVADANEGRYVDIPQDCSIVKNSVVLDLQKENTLLRNNQDEISTLYEIIGEKVGNTNLPRFTQQVAIELDKLVEEKERYFNWYDKGEKENTELKEKVKSYEDNVEEVGMTIIENLSEELGIKEERIMSCEKLCTQYGRDLGLYKRMWETLLMSYIIVSQTSDMPIYDEECCLMTHQEEDIPYEEQERMIELIKYRIDNMNSNDWNEDGGLCKLVMSSGDYGCGRRKFCNVVTRLEGFSDDSSDEDSSDDEPFATPTPQGNSN